MKNKLQEKPYSTTFGVDPNKFLLTPPRIALSGYSSPQANRRNRKIELYFFLKLDEVFFANISQGKNGKVLVRILLKILYVINNLRNLADFSKNGSKTAIH